MKHDFQQVTESDVWRDKVCGKLNLSSYFGNEITDNNNDNSSFVSPCLKLQTTTTVD